ncbi:MAG: ATP-binding protein [Anaerolineae bacterium]|nr:ATP-binding protein [Anaerolineae bacterium]
MLITSNRAITEFPALFGDPLLASAGLDRLLHDAHVVVANGPSYRAKHRIPDEPDSRPKEVTSADP